MLDFTTSDDISATPFIADQDARNSGMVNLYMYVVSTGLLASATVTIRWNDGVARSHPETLVLTTLGNMKQACIQFLQLDDTDVTYEVAITGSATVGVLIGQQPIY